MTKQILTPINEPVAKQPADPFSPDSLRLSQDFSANIGVKKAIISVPVRKPDRQWFIRTHPAEDMRLETAVLELKDDREIYLVSPEMRSELPGEVAPKVLMTTISRQGVLFLWPLRLPGEDGRLDEWGRSALEVARMASDQWIRVSANMSLGAYDSFIATGDLPEPEWPDMDLQKILKLAFRDRYIDSPEHPVVERLRGAL
ncbi:hypothetical protein N9235_00710 [Gammaproteobacteria bacterium]|nr:hypothetical protein [Gammaproteobacteria bacterium]